MNVSTQARERRDKRKAERREKTNGYKDENHPRKENLTNQLASRILRANWLNWKANPKGQQAGRNKDVVDPFVNE